MRHPLTSGKILIPNQTEIQKINITGYCQNARILGNISYGNILTRIMRFFFVMVFLIIMAKNGNCQTYKPFNFDKGIWYCKYITKGGLFGVYHGPYYATDSVKYFCNGDTTINNVMFKKLYHSEPVPAELASKPFGI